jgi:hypothetical protein
MFMSFSIPRLLLASVPSYPTLFRFKVGKTLASFFAITQDIDHPRLNMSSQTHDKPATNMSRDSENSNDMRTKTETYCSKDASQQRRTDHEVDQDEHRKAEVAPQSTRQALSSAPAPATAVSSIMGPPPPKEEKMSFWRRWKRDRKESRELRKLGMPSHGSDRRWKVAQVV